MKKIPGYNAGIPDFEEYKNFVQGFGKGVTEIDPSCGLLIHGSFYKNLNNLPNRFNSGVSDIDSTLIFDVPVVTDKKVMKEIAGLWKNLYDPEKPIEFQLTPTDVMSLKDGRFSSYISNWIEYFQSNVQIYGNDYREHMKKIRKTGKTENEIAFSMRFLRQKYLQNQILDHDELVKIFFGSTNKVKDFALRPDLDIGPANDKIDRDFRDWIVDIRTKKLDTSGSLTEYYKNREKMVDIMEKCVTFYEEGVRAIIENVPSEN